MKNRLLYILAGILLVITLIVLLRDKSSTLGRNESQAGFSDPESISSFTLSGSGKLLRFNRLDQAWLLNDSFRVKPGLAETFLTTLSTMQVKAPLSRKQRAEVADSTRTSGVETSLYAGPACIRSYYIWSRAGTFGTYLLPKGSKKPVMVEIPGFKGEPAIIFRTREEYWKDQVVFNLPLSQLATLMVREPGTGSGFLLSRAGIDQDWQLTRFPDSLHHVPVDPIALGELLRCLGRIPYLQCIAEDLARVNDSLGQIQPSRIIRTGGFNGNFEQATIYPRFIPSPKGRKEMTDPDLARVWLENSRQLVLVKYTDLDNFLLNSESLTKH